MESSGGYPMGAQYDKRAPYNQEENPEMELDVVVSVCYHKSFKVKVKDYEIIDEEPDFSYCDLYDAVERQCDLTASEKNGWTQDEFEVIIDK